MRFNKTCYFKEKLGNKTGKNIIGLKREAVDSEGRAVIVERKTVRSERKAGVLKDRQWP